MVVTRPSVRKTGLPRARPVTDLPAASANIATAVSAVQAMPIGECAEGVPDHAQAAALSVSVGARQLPDHHGGCADLDQRVQAKAS